MLQRLKRRGSLASAVMLGASLAMTAGVTAQVPFAKACSLKDIAVITLIEEHGEAGDVPADQLGKAHLTMLDARSVCAEGRVVEALALYETILDVGPVASVIRQRR